MPGQDAEQPPGSGAVNRIERADIQGPVIQAGVVGDIYVGTDSVRQQAAEVLAVSVEGFRSTTTGYSYVGEDARAAWLPGGGVKVLVEGLTTQAVVLNRMRPVIDARKPPRPARVTMSVLSVIEERGFVVDLSGSTPALVPLRPEAPDFPFMVAKGDPELFAVTPYSSDQVFWHLELDWTSAGRTGTAVIKWTNGRPFVCMPGPPDVSLPRPGGRWWRRLRIRRTRSTADG
ncbi:hypothetical protein ACFVXG_38140 [Kitasatospora sp. NPDC058162]|uniref:hypothetical protein n=1 Tax=Kitasatospora sp. NPDC058162 TaxID=3346362 RepID=UPI0036DB8E97